jgi:hypothetical protein
MKAVVTVLQSVLTFAIAASLVILALPGIISSINETMDTSEASSAMQQMELCNIKILETARTGSQNTCTFSSQGLGRGEVYLKNDGIYFQLLSDAKVCDETDWTEIDPERHIWLRCDLEESKSLYQLRWSFDEVAFILGGKNSGNILEINRVSIGEDKINLFVDFK